MTPTIKEALDGLLEALAQDGRHELVGALSQWLARDGNMGDVHRFAFEAMERNIRNQGS